MTDVALRNRKTLNLEGTEAVTEFEPDQSSEVQRRTGGRQGRGRAYDPEAIPYFS